MKSRTGMMLRSFLAVICLGFLATSLVVEAKSKPDPCDQNLDNCVVWLRTCKAPWLPQNLCTLDQKKAHIAEPDVYKAQPGYVAVMDLGLQDRYKGCTYNKKYPNVPIGHVGYVVKNSNGLITIEDTNADGKGHKRTVTKTPKDLHIIGYICDWNPNPK